MKLLLPATVMLSGVEAFLGLTLRLRLA